MSYFNECKFSLEEDDNIHKSLNNKVLGICRSNIEKEKFDIELKNNSNINVRKKNQKQLAYFSTKEKLFYKKIFFNPTAIEPEYIKKSSASNNEDIL